MLLFLASVIEQLDLALEHIGKGDIHNARFGLMLTDNALELVLHQIAKDRSSDLMMLSLLRKTYPHEEALAKALGRNFDAKLKFAKIEKSLSDELAQTITIMHGYRNEVYHVGLKHESILPALSKFYFDATCTFLESYQPPRLSWNSGLQLPDRAKRYLGGDNFVTADFGDFSKACRTLKKACNHNTRYTISTLANALDEIISLQDTCIDIVAAGVYEGQRRTRNVAVAETQAWRLAFSEEGKAFALKGKFRGNPLQLIEWLKKNYRFEYKSDPIPSWRTLAAKLRANKNPHRALSNYQSFLASTAFIRETLEESATAAEREIDMLVDIARGK